MPIYEYKCSRCGEKFEELIAFSKLNDNNPKCPKCDSKEVERQISTPSIGNSKNSCGTSNSNPGFT
ncbi:MAG: zinc ribbon domain-containing protein [Candidatus Marinimicrobia bacterium]|nr:zinc ribbon domain-containing protein [Candidatus Neomarinimicrobiota bacterium]